MNKLGHFFVMSKGGSYTLALFIILSNLNIQAQSKRVFTSVHEIYDLDSYYPRKDGIEPIYIGESPMNEATVQVFHDGSIKAYHTPARYSDRVLSISSLDGGYTWEEPVQVLKDSIIWQYPRRTLIDKNGTLHLLVFKRENNDVLHTKSHDNGITWSKFQTAANGRIGAIRGFLQTRSGRLILGFHRRIADRKPPYGTSFTSSVYSDDGGETWKESISKIVAPVYEEYIGSNYGFVEPNIVELEDGRIWMLGRTQTGYLYQSFSNDKGETWTDGEASIFHSSNSPANILELPDGRLVLTWCNTVDPEISTFGKIYTHRDVLHMAISDDHGRNWTGFREIMRIPTRNDQNDMPRGDSGVSYPNTSFTKDGKIILVTGQGEHGGGRAIWLLDPGWLYQKVQEEDFSNGLEKWTAYTFMSFQQKPGRKLGPQLLLDTQAKGGKVLHIRKSDENAFGDAALWNFPMGQKGIIEMRVKIPKDSKGCAVSLMDCHRHPNDPNGISEAMFSLLLKETEAIALEADLWQIVKLKWDLNARNCQVFVNNKFTQNVRLTNETEMGISYIRFSSLGEEGQVDMKGMMLDWIKADSR